MQKNVIFPTILDQGVSQVIQKPFLQTKSDTSIVAHVRTCQYPARAVVFPTVAGESTSQLLRGERKVVKLYLGFGALLPLLNCRPLFCSVTRKMETRLGGQAIPRPAVCQVFSFSGFPTQTDGRGPSVRSLGRPRDFQSIGSTVGLLLLLKNRNPGLTMHSTVLGHHLF